MDIKPQTSKIKNRAGVIDVIAQDSNTGEVVLVMNEPEPWDDSDERLLALQERFNAYVSFLLDGEMAETNPNLADRPARIELRCAHIPDTRALELLASGRVPLDELVEAEDFPLNRLLDAAIGLHEGRLPAKAMVVPRVDPEPTLSGREE